MILSKGLAAGEMASRALLDLVMATPPPAQPPPPPAVVAAGRDRRGALPVGELAPAPAHPRRRPQTLVCLQLLKPISGLPFFGGFGNSMNRSLRIGQTPRNF
jgi:hypothetical protein